MRRFAKVYLEITNRCNLACRFCPGTRRAPGQLDVEQFSLLLDRLKGKTEFLYFHLMGEPLCHPELVRFLELAGAAGFRVILTTNGVLLPHWQERLLASDTLYKVNISLHAYEANDLPVPLEEYLAGCLAFGRAAAGEKLIVYRLWNEGGEQKKNPEILQTVERYFPRPWQEQQRGVRVGERVYLEPAEKFSWPDLNGEDTGERVFCYGLRDQIGILCDGTVVPCCLDHDGDIALGNLFKQELDDILETPRARSILTGFDRRQAQEPLCRRCGFAKQRFG